MVDNPRGTGPRPNKMPARKIKLNRVYPDRPSLVDSGSQRVGMVRQSPVRYELVFDKEGVNIVNSETNEKVDTVTAAKITDGIMATQLAEERMRKMSQSDFTGMPRVSGTDVTNRLREQTLPNRSTYVAEKEPPVTYNPLRGYSAPNVGSRRPAPSNIYGNPSGRTISDQDRFNAENRVQNNNVPVEDFGGLPQNPNAYEGDPEFDIMMTPPGGGMAYGGVPKKKKKKKKMYGGKMKKYAKGGGIRKPKYS